MHPGHATPASWRYLGTVLTGLSWVALAPVQQSLASTPALECAGPAFVSDVAAAVAQEAGTKRLLGGAGSEIEVTPRFLVVYDRELRLFAPPWTSPQAFARAFEVAEDAWMRSQGDGIRALLVFTVFDPGRSDLFYVPVANDVRGLGVGTAATVFDDRPNSRLEGLIFMGEPKQLVAAGDDYFREAFLHEIAHRWLTYPQIVHPELEPDALRGRQSAHWSYFVHSGTSPMEGNDWEQTEPGIFRTRVDAPTAFRFSALDRYLMGLIAAHEVPPFWVLRPTEILSPAGLAIDRGTAPARRNGQPVTLRAEAIEIGVQHLIAGSGPRNPEADLAERPIPWPIGVVVLSRGKTLSPVSRASLAALENRLERFAGDFEEATLGQMHLEFRVPGAADASLFGACEHASACNLAQTDRCERLVEGPGFCTRACAADSECGAGVCCPGLGFCTPVGGCNELPVPPSSSPDGSTDDAGSGKDDDPGPGSCASTPSDETFAVFVLLFWLRLAVRRRESRGNPA